MLQVQSLARAGLVVAPFALADGECVAVRGPSGAGKTLLLRAIADLDPNHGDLLLDGRPRASMRAPEWRRQVVYVPAESGWWAETVGAHFARWSPSLSLLERLSLPEDCREWPVARLSTGERQRLSLIRTLVLNPRVLLLDEPTSGLDPEVARAAEQLLAEHFAGGVGALWVTHDPAQAARLARRTLLVENGRVCERLA